MTEYTLEVFVSIRIRFLPPLPSGAIPPADSALPFAERMLALNHYLLDGFVREGLPCAGREWAQIEGIYILV
jgi:hypothetical protein